MIGSCYFIYFLFFCVYLFGFWVTVVKIYHLEVCYVLLLGTLFSSQGHLTTVSSFEGRETE